MQAQPRLRQAALMHQNDMIGMQGPRLVYHRQGLVVTPEPQQRFDPQQGEIQVARPKGKCALESRQRVMCSSGAGKHHGMVFQQPGIVGNLRDRGFQQRKSLIHAALSRPQHAKGMEQLRVLGLNRQQAQIGLFRGRQIALAKRGRCLVEDGLKVHGGQITDEGAGVIAPVNPVYDLPLSGCGNDLNLKESSSWPDCCLIINCAGLGLSFLGSMR